MPEAAKPKQKLDPKEKQMQALKAEKAFVQDKYKDFKDIGERFTSDEKLAKALDVNPDYLRYFVTLKPEYANLVSKIKTMAFNGYAALLRVKGTVIEKGANLLALKGKLGTLKAELSATLKSWFEKHSKLKKAVKAEYARSGLMSFVQNYVLLAYQHEILVEEHTEYQAMLQKTPVYKKLMDKIKNASIDEITYMADNKDLFTELKATFEHILETERARSDLKSSMQLEIYSISASVEQDLNFASYPSMDQDMEGLIYNTPFYKQEEAKLDKAGLQELKEIQRTKDSFLKNLKGKFEMMAYQMGANVVLDAELQASYAKLKPQGMGENDFLDKLKNSKQYKDAIAYIEKTPITELKKFDPKKFLGAQHDAASPTPNNTLTAYAKNIVRQHTPRDTI